MNVIRIFIKLCKNVSQVVCLKPFYLALNELLIYGLNIIKNKKC